MGGGGAGRGPAPPGRGVRLIVNGARRTVPTATTVEGLVESLGLDPRLVVVERNLEILDREAYGRHRLGEGDRIEIVHFVGGG